jgi:hypothetical protein
MPKGPRGEKRPADVVGAAIMVARISVGDLNEELRPEERQSAGRAGGAGRANKLSPQRRREIAQDAAKARWGK